MKFSLIVSSVNVTKSTVSCGFGQIYWRKYLMENFIFLCSDYDQFFYNYAISYHDHHHKWYIMMMIIVTDGIIVKKSYIIIIIFIIIIIIIIILCHWYSLVELSDSNLDLFIIPREWGTMIPAGNHMFKVNNRNTRTRYEICSKLAIKTPYFTSYSSVSIVNIEQVSAGWYIAQISINYHFCQQE